MLDRFLKEKKAQGEWNSIYIVLILGIVAVVLIAKIKPMFKESLSVGSQTEGVSTPAVNSAK